MNSYIYDEIDKVVGIATPKKGVINKHKVCWEFVVFVNDSTLSQMFACTTIGLAKKIDSMCVHIVCEGDENLALINDYCGTVFCEQPMNNIERLHLYKSTDVFAKEHAPFTYEKVRFCTFLDCYTVQYNDTKQQKEYLESADKIFSLAATVPGCKLVHTTLLPEIQPFPGELAEISEREYEVYAAQFDSNSREALLLNVEEVLRPYVRNGLNAVVGRMAPLYGPGIQNCPLDGIINCEHKTIHCDTAERESYVGLNYIRYALSNVYFLFVRGVAGNIYHVQGEKTDRFHLALKCYDLMAKHGFALRTETTAEANRAYRLLCNKKIEARSNADTKKYRKIHRDEFLYNTLMWTLPEIEPIYSTDIFTYDGKLDIIKQLELETAEEIKRICEKYDIKYFLVGGSMLGAVRHHGIIPWDDDIDIGMLREEYEKFRKVAPAELSDRYTYQSPETEPGSNYVFDKIRLKDTYFNTKFSNLFQIQNGIFVDLLVYDKTSANEHIRKIHIRLIRAWIRLLTIRWVNYPRKNVHYRFSKIMLPFMRLFPMSFYHKVLRRMLKRFNRTKSPWAIDGVGQNLKKGAFPIEWLEETIDVPFEDTIFPIPKDYDAYLRHWYGDNYMEWLPPAKRVSDHKLKRIDLGSYIQRMGFPEGRYHELDLRGELWDSFGDSDPDDT